MSDVSVEVDQVWKKFHRGETHDSLRDCVPTMVRRLCGHGIKRGELAEAEFWALRDVSFQVKRGEALGIIGPNGAGKSTMLKLLTKILRATRGHCRVRGRLGALIELSAGFHPDLTGHENIFLQGTIMGMKRAEIARKLDAIIDFAGIHDFIDMPVKRYSSGMYARLGFSIAAHLEPDVLLIDEVLSVGDMAFQQRCLERMRDFKAMGVAIVFVSHNLQAVASLCDTGLYLRGEVGAQGPAQEVIRNYLRSLSKMATRIDGAEVELVGAELADDEGLPVTTVDPGVRLTARVTYKVRKAITDLTFGFIVHRSTDGLTVYDGNVQGEELGLDSLAEGETIVVDFAFRAHLTRGQYHIECHCFHRPTQRHLSRICPAGFLTVEENRTYAGVADLEVRPAVVKRIAQKARASK